MRIKLRDCTTGRWVAFNPDDVILMSLRCDRKTPELSLHLMSNGTVIHESIYLAAQLEEGDSQFGDSGLASDVFNHLAGWPNAEVPHEPGAVIPVSTK